MSKIYFVATDKLSFLIERLKDTYTVFSPAAKVQNYTRDTDYSFQKHSSRDPLVFNPYRCVEPLKSFFTLSKEKASDYFISADNLKDLGQVIIFGVKSCDLAAHRVQDYVFLEGVVEDSLYRARRENTIIISSDCTAYKEVCFCLAMDVLPHPTAGFDINLSPLNDGFLAEVGSNRGQELIDNYPEYFSPAKDTQVSARAAKRNNLIERLKRDLAPKKIPPTSIQQRLVRDGFNLDTWNQFMQTCVECGGCNLICDTCHCFLLEDRKTSGTNEKIKMWDSCLYANYARVAGGANPNKLRAQRLRFRFTKKFDFFFEHLKMPACCGCGRCIEVCPGKIDIREVLKDLAKKLNLAQ
ncbi:MAG: 4Fe-4S dicluster domain-containing protein [Candidatus Omnitrophota bacterium]